MVSDERLIHLRANPICMLNEILTNTQAVYRFNNIQRKNCCQKINLVSWSLELLLLSYLLLRERWLLILLVLVCIAGISGLIGRITFVCWLEWNFCDACLVAEESKIGASAPGESWEEWENDCTSHVATSDSIWWIWWFGPLTADVTKSNEEHECPEARKSKISKHIMLSALRWWHLLEEIFTNDETHRCEKANESNPNGKRTNASVSVDDTDIFVVLIFHVSIGADWTEDDDRKDLKL